MSTTSEYVDGLDAATEIERQISLTVNNLAHEFSLALMSHDVAVQLCDVRHTKFNGPDGSYWNVQFEKECLRIESISFWYSNEGREPLEWLKWTAETKGENGGKKVKNYLWMRRARRPQDLMKCHSGLDVLISGLASRFSEMKEHVDDLAEIRKYALLVGK